MLTKPSGRYALSNVQMCVENLEYNGLRYQEYKGLGCMTQVRDNKKSNNCSYNYEESKFRQEVNSISRR